MACQSDSEENHPRMVGGSCHCRTIVAGHVEVGSLPPTCAVANAIRFFPRFWYL